ncbi:MAG TPA: hypothetical protein PKA00_12845 [Saprospiraceae bacterium]|nr:hypothetical protein [Saprospiraceae bacterium]HMQ83796.1 hypothetical protein [Saprospiraceae bacterium]
MIKWLMTGLIIYAIYKFFFAGPALSSGDQRDRKRPIEDNHTSKQKDKSVNDGDYIDYEEVE